MFGIFKRKTEKEKLLIRYKKIKNEAFILSKINRRKSDEKEKEANDIIDAINKIENTEK
ncbi:MAG: Lacal_2735 family protein [Flavobacteriales bacterium]|nr:Lacal_2735 family protein [Flavobacteriales bacterium]|tara:strand:- start:1244 stop:1420 length:177 start_codon:yes stop_codon:yes gene_type:complete